MTDLFEPLRDKPDARVLIVGNAKAAEAVSTVLPAFAVITWEGGVKGIKQTDWTPLAGRGVDLWPTADKAGFSAMAKVIEALAAVGVKDMRRIVPEGRNSGWDAAAAVQEFPTAKELIGWIKRDGGVHVVPVVLPSPAELVSDQVEAAPTLEQVSPLSPTQDVAEAASAPSRLRELRSINAVQARWSALGIREDVMHNGRPPANEDMVYRLCSYLGDMFWFDTFLGRGMTTWESKEPVPVNKDIISKLTVFMQRELAMPRISKEKIAGGLDAYGVDHKRNVAQEWLHSLTWDGKDRLDLLLTNGFGTEDDDYNAAVGRCFLIGTVRRVLEPGCQMDNVMLLQGPQGNLKSSALRILGGPWYTEQTEPVQSKDFYQNLRGKMIVELSEMASLRGASIEKVRQVITNRVDTFRSSYGMMSEDYPRQCVFTCTTNNMQWNTDDTGAARRFWPVMTGHIELDWLRENREQLFAEAVHRCKAGESHWNIPDDKQKQLAEEARRRHPWEEVIPMWMEALPSGRPYAKTSEVYEMLGVTMDKQTGDNLYTITRIMHLYGYVNKTVREGKITLKAWRKSRLPVIGPEPTSEADEGTLQEDGPAFINYDA
jgi:putative DNA primase/helicase